MSTKSKYSDMPPCSGKGECEWRLVQIERRVLRRQPFPPVSHSTKSVKSRREGKS